MNGHGDAELYYDEPAQIFAVHQALMEADGPLDAEVIAVGFKQAANASLPSKQSSLRSTVWTGLDLGRLEFCNQAGRLRLPLRSDLESALQQRVCFRLIFAWQKTADLRGKLVCMLWVMLKLY